MSSSDQHIYGEPVQDQMLLKPKKPNLTELGPAQPPLVFKDSHGLNIFIGFFLLHISVAASIARGS